MAAQAKRFEELIKKLLDGTGSGRGRHPKAPKATDPLGDLIAGLDTAQANRLESLRDHWVDLIDPLEKFRREYAEVEDLAREGYLTSDQALAAYRQLDTELEKLGQTTGSVATEAQKAFDDMDAFGRRAAENIQDAFADFLFDPFKDGVDGMFQHFATTLQRMAAEAVAADLSKRLFGQNGKDLAPLVLNLASWAFGGTQAPAPVEERLIPHALGGVFGNGEILTQPTAFRFASGGAFRTGVAGEAGPEGALPLKRMSNGKLGVYADGGGGLNLTQHFHIAGNADAATIRRAGAQSARELMAVLRRSGRYE